MNRKYFGFVAILIASIAVGGALQGGDAKDPPKGDLKKIQGTWKFTAHTHGDKAAPEEQLAKMKITFSGDKFSVTMDGKVVQAGTQKLDSSKKPAHIDSNITEGENKGTTMLGIYELKGDTVKVCFDPQGKERPTSLTAKDGQFSATIQREKKK